MSIIHIEGDTVIKQLCTDNELKAASYFLDNPNDFIIPIISVSFSSRMYTMALGTTDVKYDEPALINWLKKLYSWLQEQLLSHNDVHLNPGRPNIVRYQGNYRLIDLADVNLYRQSFKDFYLIGQLIKRIENNLRD